MADDKRERGARKMEDVCGMPAPPAGFGRFVDLTVEHLFGEVWGNEALSVRDRRLVVLGILGALGDDSNLAAHMGQALKRGDVTAEQLDEIVVTVAHYAGWPRSTHAHAAAGTAKSALAEAQKKG
ncbi:carboxymuconolactone decarboxylase family protein [Candidatus Binatia bacterium]|jgi:4-carboxymuconolactone decarboxylase|nr:carboxymuconolactone decarboxylase family protein [Candidatus Binatia bacterium]